jgi:hypothetical protein
MRSLLLLLLGTGIGIVATVMFITLNPTFETSERDGAGGGNARLSLDEDALATLIHRELTATAGFEDITRVNVRILEEGVIEVETTVAATRIVGVRGTIVLNPDIQDGRLRLRVVSAGQIDLPEEIARLIEAPLQARLDNLASGLDYRLTSITTTDRRLTLEIAI